MVLHFEIELFWITCLVIIGFHLLDSRQFVNLCLMSSGHIVTILCIYLNGTN